MRFSITMKAKKAGAATPAFCFQVAGQRAACWPRRTWATDTCSATRAAKQVPISQSLTGYFFLLMIFSLVIVECLNPCYS